MLANRDLIWSLGQQNYNERNVGFLKRFEKSMCLFSVTVGQLYTNYEIFPVNTAPNRLLALPNPYAFHDTFFNIPADAIKPTGLYIVPDEAANDHNSKGLRLVFKSRKDGRTKVMPLKKGIEAARKAYQKQGEFLPVMVNSDLSFRKNNQPVMHLHQLDLSKLTKLSVFQTKDIASSIRDKLGLLIDSANN